MQKNALHQLEDASWDGDIQTVHRLLAAGVDPAEGHSCCLMHAAHRGHPVIVELLLASGADPQARRSEALYRAARGRTTGHQACMRLLLPLSEVDRWEAWEWAELPVSSRLRLKQEAHERHFVTASARAKRRPGA